MDALQQHLPEFVRHLSTILVVHAAAKDSTTIQCAPILHCLVGEPTELESRGFSYTAIGVSFSIGLTIGGSLVLLFLQKSERKPSAASIALSRSK